MHRNGEQIVNTIEHELVDLRSVLMRRGIWGIVVVPSHGLDLLYDAFDSLGRCLFVTREEEGVAVASGIALAGAIPMVVMQQTGVGNALNAVFALAEAYEIYFPILVHDRGPADANPVQRLSSLMTSRVLSSLAAVEVSLGRNCIDVDRALAARARWLWWKRGSVG